MAIPASVAFLVALTGCGAAEQPPASSVPSTTTTATPSPDAATPSATASEPTPLDGTYAITWGVEELAKALGGADNPTAAMDARNNFGTVRFVFDRGRYDMRYERDGSSCPGTFVVTGDRVVMTATTKPSEWHCGDGLGAQVADAAWQLAGDELRFTDFELPATPGISWFMEPFLGTKPLQRES
jgi:hypothetical protein